MSARTRSTPRRAAGGEARLVVPDADAAGLKAAVVVSRYNETITDRLLEGAAWEFVRLGGATADLTIVRAPGAFELPALSLAAAESGADLVVALGCIVKGETSHDRVIADAVAAGLVQVTLRTGVPVAFGVLTVDTWAQAEARSQAVGEADVIDDGASGKKKVDNKGVEAMAAAVSTALAMRELRGARRSARRRV